MLTNPGISKKLDALHFMSKPRNAEEIYYLVALALEEYLLLYVISKKR
jgi:hypothetical protein